LGRVGLWLLGGVVRSGTGIRVGLLVRHVRIEFDLCIADVMIVLKIKRSRLSVSYVDVISIQQVWSNGGRWSGKFARTSRTKDGLSNLDTNADSRDTYEIV